MSISVIAIARGYYRSKVRDIGERFVLSDEAHFSKSWMERASSAPPEPASFAAPAQAGAAGPVDIPADWAGQHYAKRVALARLIAGLAGGAKLDAAAADAIVAGEVARRAAVQAGEAKEGNGLVAATGGVAPDWIDPASGIGAGAPVAKG